MTEDGGHDETDATTKVTGVDARIDSDAPTERDDLGRAPYVRTLARIVRTAETPLVIAIYGAWGAGKTSLMKQLRRQLDPGHDGQGVGEQHARTVWFDPWMHQFDDSPALALLHAAADQLDIATRRNVVASLSKLAVALGEDIQVPFIGVRVGKLLSVRAALAQEAFNRREERARLRDHFHDALKATGAPDKRVVFFIDDLDRCQPAVALSLLEALKLYLDVPGCVYVLGVDREPLEAAVGAQYATLGLRSASYLDKIIQLPFAIPAINETAMASFVEKRLPGELSGCAQILAAATADEPRNVKRLANSLLINHELAREASFESYDPRILTMVVLIQNQAPSLYRQLRFDPSLITELFRSRHPPDPSDDAGGDGVEVGLWALYVRENPRLERALMLIEPLLIELPADLDLTPYITLTAITRVETASSVGLEAGQVYISNNRRGTGAGRIANSLTQLGWSVVHDVGLAPGADYAAVRSALEASDGVIALIGPRWRDDAQMRAPHAWINAELEYARELGRMIIPVLIEGARMPAESDLPKGLHFLATINALDLRDDESYSRGIAQLDRALRQASRQAESRASPSSMSS
jgi:hypothetical protein